MAQAKVTVEDWYEAGGRHGGFLWVGFEVRGPDDAVLKRFRADFTAGYPARALAEAPIATIRKMNALHAQADAWAREAREGAE